MAGERVRKPEKKWYFEVEKKKEDQWKGLWSL